MKLLIGQKLKEMSNNNKRILFWIISGIITFPIWTLFIKPYIPEQDRDLWIVVAGAVTGLLSAVYANYKWPKE